MSSCWHSFRLILQTIGFPVFEPEKIEKHENRKAASMREASTRMLEHNKNSLEMQNRAQTRLDAVAKKVKKLIKKTGGRKFMTLAQKSDLSMLMNQKNALAATINKLQKHTDSIINESAKFELGAYMLSYAKVREDCVKGLKKAGITNIKGFQESTKKTETGLDELDEILKILEDTNGSREGDENVVNEPDLSKFSDELKEIEEEVGAELQREVDELELPAEKKSVKNLKSIVNNNRKKDVVLEVLLSSEDEEAEDRVESLLKSSKKKKQIDSD